MGYNDSRLASLVSSGAGNFQEINHFLARSHAEKEQVFRLRYEAYLDEGFIDENDDRLLADKYDRDASSVIYGVTLRGRLASTIRLNILSDDHRASSSYDLFGDYLDPILDLGKKVVDGTRLAVRCDTNVARRNVLLYTLGLTAMFAAKNYIHYGAIAVREGHVPFYERHGFNVVGEPRQFVGIRLARKLMLKNLEEYFDDAHSPKSSRSHNNWNCGNISQQVRG